MPARGKLRSSPRSDQAFPSARSSVRSTPRLEAQCAVLESMRRPLLGQVGEGDCVRCGKSVCTKCPCGKSVCTKCPLEDAAALFDGPLSKVDPALSPRPFTFPARHISATELEDCLAFAAWNVEDALEGFHAEDYPRGQVGVMLRERTNMLFRIRQCYCAFSIILLLVTLFEPPLWCVNWYHTSDFISVFERCPLPGGAVAQFSLWPMIPPLYGLFWEASSMTVVTLSMVYERTLRMAFEKSGVSGVRRRGPRPLWFAGLLLLMWLDFVYFCIVRQQSIRFAPYGRILLLGHFPNVRSVVNSALRCVEDWSNIAIFMLGAVILFAWFVVMILDDIKDETGTSAMVAYGGEDFGSFTAAVNSLFQIMTGANFPEAIDPLISKLRWMTIIFYPFMILGFFLFTQLMLATVYKAYQDHLKEELVDFHTQRAASLSDAFTVLAERECDEEELTISIDRFQGLIRHLSAFPKMKRSLRGENPSIIIAVLDDDGDHKMTGREFFDACELLQYKFWTTPEHSIFVRDWGWNLDRVQSIIASGQLELAVDVTLLLNGLFIIISSWFDLNDIPDPGWCEPVGLFFSMVYMLEVCLQLLAFSFRNYWSHGQHRFNFLVSWLLFLAGIATVFRPFGGIRSVYLRYVNLLRMFRLVKLLTSIPRFRMMTECILKLISISKDIAVLLFLTIFSFAVVGAQAFGGRLYATNPLLAGSKYLDSGYVVLSFNDMGGSIETLFVMMVNNYMPEYADAMGRILAAEYGGRFYFVGIMYCSCFFFVGVTIAFNIFTAFTIDVFVQLKEDQEDEAEREEHDSDDGLVDAAAGNAATPRSGILSGTSSSSGSSSKSSQDAVESHLARMREILATKGYVLHVSISAEVTRSKMQLSIVEGLEHAVRKARSVAQHHSQRNFDSMRTTSQLVGSNDMARMSLLGLDRQATPTFMGSEPVRQDSQAMPNLEADKYDGRPLQ